MKLVNINLYYTSKTFNYLNLVVQRSTRNHSDCVANNIYNLYNRCNKKEIYLYVRPKDQTFFVL